VGLYNNNNARDEVIVYKTVLALVSLIILSFNGNAATLEGVPADFTGVVLSPFSAFTAFNDASYPDSNGNVNYSSMDAYEAVDNGVNGYLLQYHLTEQSTIQSISYEGGSSNTDISGDLFLFVAGSYVLGGSNHHQVDVYFENTSNGGSIGLFGGGQSSMSFYLTDEGLMNNSGSFYIDCCGEDYNASSPPVNTMSADIYPCAADGCSASALLNLLFVDYQAIGSAASLTFDNSPAASGLVYQQTDAFEGSVTMNLAVGNVPVPAAAWLFGSALVGLAGIKRKK
jgi:hypothetical protein